MKSKALSLTLSLFLVGLILLTACGSPAPTATPVPAKPTAAPAAPTAAPAATAKPAPTAAPTAPPAAKVQIPDPIIISTYEVGGSGYMFTAGLGEAITKATGVKVRVFPTTSSPARTAMVTTGKAHGFTSGGDIWVEGIQDYAKMEWGPIPLRLVYNTFMLGQAMYVRGDSPITKMSDLRGKKVDLATRGIENFHEGACLAFGGLTWKDVDTSMNLPSGAAAAEALKTGRVDSMSYTIDAAFMMELETIPGGVRVIPMPPEDKQGWARLHEIAPWLSPRFAKPGEGAGLGKEGAWVWSKSYPSLSVMDNMPNDVAYFLTKTLVENYALWRDYNPQTKASTPESALDIVGKAITPYHPGSIRYWKEKGLWTDKHERWTNALVERQAMLKAAFEKVLAMAADQKIKEADFPAFWLKNKPPQINIEETLAKAGIS